MDEQKVKRIATKAYNATKYATSPLHVELSELEFELTENVAIAKFEILGKRLVEVVIWVNNLGYETLVNVIEEMMHEVCRYKGVAHE